MLTELEILSLKYDSDKFIDHDYISYYEEILAPIRDDEFKLLEIGVGGYSDPQEGGNSLRVFRDYLSKASIYAIDNQSKTIDFGPNIYVSQIDQSKRGELLDYASLNGPFRVIIDDGSHNPKDVISSFETLFPWVEDGGFYIIEDLQTSFWPEYGGTPAVDEQTQVNFLFSLINRIHNPEIRLKFADARKSSAELTVSDVKIGYNIAIIRAKSGQRFSNFDLANGVPQMLKAAQLHESAFANCPMYWKRIFRYHDRLGQIEEAEAAMKKVHALLSQIAVANADQ